MSPMLALSPKLAHRIALVAFASSCASVTAGPAFAGGPCGLARGFSGGVRQTHCLHVEERLRVDPRARRDMSPWGATNAFTPLPPQQDGAMAAHLRLDGAYGVAPDARLR
jgi:hypothetical protein